MKLSDIRERVRVEYRRVTTGAYDIADEPSSSIDRRALLAKLDVAMRRLAMVQVCKAHILCEECLEKLDAALKEIEG